MLSTSLAQSALDLLTTGRRILLLTHQNPDGDAIGSLLGMGLLIKQHVQGSDVLFLCKDSAPAPFSFLPSVHAIAYPDMLREGDVLCILDAAEPKLTGLLDDFPDMFDQSHPTLVIDHHPTNTSFGTEHIIFPETSSSCEIVYLLAEKLGWSLTSDIATCLLTGIYTDTGGLLHSNTTAQVYRIVSALLKAGARQQEIVQHVFRTSSLSTLRLWGRVLEKISLTEEGAAISAVTKADFNATGADYSQLTGAIDYLNAIPGLRFSLILSERGDKVKGSLRTLRDDVDVASMAQSFRGGGHTKAAGFAIEGSLKPEVRWKVVPKEPTKSE